MRCRLVRLPSERVADCCGCRADAWPSGVAAERTGGRAEWLPSGRVAERSGCRANRWPSGVAAEGTRGRAEWLPSEWVDERGGSQRTVPSGTCPRASLIMVRPPAEDLLTPLPYGTARTRGVAAGRSAQRACERSSDWRRGAAGSPDPEDLPRARSPDPEDLPRARSPDPEDLPRARSPDPEHLPRARSPDPEKLLGSLDPKKVPPDPLLFLVVWCQRKRVGHMRVRHMCATGLLSKPRPSVG
jgi:hypothetical protein